MKKWNAPSVEELNINETANGMRGYFAEGYYGTIIGPKSQTQTEPEVEKQEEEKPSTPSDNLS